MVGAVAYREALSTNTALEMVRPGPFCLLLFFPEEGALPPAFPSERVWRFWCLWQGAADKRNVISGTFAKGLFMKRQLTYASPCWFTG